MGVEPAHRDDARGLPRGLYALIDDGVKPGLDLLATAEAALAGGARVLQLRLKHLGDRAALALAIDVVAAARAHHARVLINDRVDLALLAKADGVHLGDTDVPVSAARAVLGPDALIGATTRSLVEIEQAARDGADHVGLGPVFLTRTKHIPHPLLGVEGLSKLCRASPLPVVAIAGITRENIGGVARAGARCAAVAGALLEGGDVGAATRALVAEFERN